MRRVLLFSSVLLVVCAALLISADPRGDARSKKGSRGAERNGWIPVHLEGTPAEIGFQHGYLLSAEIQDSVKDISFEFKHEENKDWEFFRKTAREVFWPHIEQQYRDELTGIAEGLKARNVRLDVWDITALNAWLELPYYDKWYDHAKPGEKSVPDHCSAFVATGSYTKDGRVVIGHNNWTSLLFGRALEHYLRYQALIWQPDDYGWHARAHP